MVMTDDPAKEMRHHQADKPDRTGNGYSRPCEDASGDEDQELPFLDRYPDVACLILPETHPVQLFGIEQQQKDADHEEWQNDPHILPASHGHASEQPSDDLSQFLPCESNHKGDERPQERTEDDAGEDDGLHLHRPFDLLSKPQDDKDGHDGKQDA